jgi:hypothetical protein
LLPAALFAAVVCNVVTDEKSAGRFRMVSLQNPNAVRNGAHSLQLMGDRLGDLFKVVTGNGPIEGDVSFVSEDVYPS